MAEAPSGEHVIVVGAGVIGIACAHFLAKTNVRVTLIDQGRIAGGCSHGNCGFISPSHVLPLTVPGAVGVALKSLFNPRAPFRVCPSLRPEMWNWMWQFARRCHRQQMLAAAAHLQAILDSSLRIYQDVVRDEALACEWRDAGLLCVLQSEAGMRKYAESNQLLTDHFGVQAQRLEGDALSVFEPALKPGLAGAFHYPNDASVRPDLLTRHWSSRLRDKGVEFLEQCQLTGVKKRAGRITHLETSHGDIRADQFVFAAGAWSARLSDALQCKIPVEPGKGYSVTLTPQGTCPKHPLLFPEHKVGVTPFEEGTRIGSIMEFAGFDARIHERRIQQLRDSAANYMREPARGAVQETWSGFRPMTWDSLPIIGRLPELPNGYLATGHNMLGLSLAAATGKLIAEIMVGQTPHIDPSGFAPDRFA